MADFFLDAFNALSGDDFEEIPVNIETFVTSEDFLNLKPLSPYQYQIVRAGSQIYRLDTLINIYGQEEGMKRYDQTFNEIILQLGKGSGKDFTSVIVCLYIVYLLLCLKDPAGYYGQNRDDSIDIINIAVNSDQAKNVFFKNFVRRLKNCRWFDGRYKAPTQNSVEFDKSVTLYSGHSEREAFEGLNLMVAVLDEISAFALESNTGNRLANTASATYQMYRDSVDSRYSEFGKVIMLSFPRFKDDYIQQKYNNAVAEKEVIMRHHTLKLEPDLPDGIEGNEIEVVWEEDHIIKYKYPKTFVLKRPSWEVNPLKKIEMYAVSFFENMANALGKYACMPSDSTDDSFFKNKEAIDRAFVLQNPVDERGVFLESFIPKPDTNYFMHVDLSKVHDRCAIALAHVDSWKTVKVGDHYSETYPVVVVDAIRWWKPSHDQPMDYKEVTDYIISVKNRGFNLKLVTFDRWNSNDTMNFLGNYHIKTDLVSVANKHYDDFLSVMYDDRLLGPRVDELVDELKQLRYIKDKVDHIRSGYKDLSDATCGAIFDAVQGTPKPVSSEVEVVSLADLNRQRREEQRYNTPGVITAPKQSMPEHMRGFLDGLRLL